MHLIYPAIDRSHLSLIKKEIHSLTIKAGFDEVGVGELDIIVAEITSNLVKHADGGMILVKPIEEYQRKGIEIISIDNGPGITDVSRMLKDGMSTKNTLGQGLGAIKRLSHLFQIYSQKDWGTIMLIRKFDSDLPSFKKPLKTEARSVILAKKGESFCGDMFYTKSDSRFLYFFLGDGLGHGEEAAIAVKKAGEAFHLCMESEPVEIIKFMNTHVKKTRGLVGTVAVLNMHTRKWKICGVGNIMTRILAVDYAKNHTSYNGIIGLNVPNTLTAQEMNYETDQYLVMCSDGIKSRWDISRHPNILKYDPSVVATTILKDYNRHSDDVSSVVCKVNI